MEADSQPAADRYIRRLDADNNYYYVSQNDGSSSYEAPALAHVYDLELDPATSSLFLVNLETGASHWLPYWKDSQSVSEVDGSLVQYWYNEWTDHSQWEVPEWRDCVDEESGELCYVHATSGEKQWERPETFFEGWPGSGGRGIKRSRNAVAGDGGGGADAATITNAAAVEEGQQRKRGRVAPPLPAILGPMPIGHAGAVPPLPPQALLGAAKAAPPALAAAIPSAVVAVAHDLVATASAASAEDVMMEEDEAPPFSNT